MLREAGKSTRENPILQKDVASHPKIKSWRDAFRRFGVKPSDNRPSVDGLARRASKGYETSYINTIVALSNYISLKYLVPSGTDDLDKVEGGFGIKIAKGDEIFKPIDSDEIENPESGEVIYADEKKVMCRRWVWKQGSETMVTDESKNVSINIDILPPVTREEGEEMAKELAKLVREFCGGEVTYNVLDRENQEEIFLLEKELEKPKVKYVKKEAKPEVLEKKERLEDWTIHDLINRGSIEEIIVKDEFLALLRSGRKIKIYQGYDPTTPDLHIGHLVSLRILRWFQLQGHHVIFLLGDATGLIGDPSGRTEKRELLTPEKVKKNMATYKDQAGLILDFEGKTNPVELLQNSKWLLDLTLKDMIFLMAKITAQRLLERDMFQERIKKGEPLYFVETIYPLLQGYDSVAMEVDAELGGRDQLFNMMVGRDLVKEYLGKKKYVITTPLIPGFDGQKMSKTKGNTVELTAAPFHMFDKIMQLHDELIVDYSKLLTNISWEELEKIEEDVAKDPLNTKERLAFEIVKMLHNEKDAEEAHKEFIEVRRKGKLPEEIPTVNLNKAKFVDKEVSIIDLLSETTPSILPSRGEARRMVRNRGVFFEEKRIENIDFILTIDEIEDKIVRIGKKKFFKITVK